MCETLNSSLAAATLLAREELLELVRRHVDVGDHVALPQGAQGEFLAHALAVLLVVDALRGERRGQLVERDFVALAISCRALRSTARRRWSGRPAWRAEPGSPAMINRSSTCCLSTLCGGSSTFCSCSRLVTASICASSSLFSTRPSLTTAAMRSSSSPCTPMSRVWAWEAADSRDGRNQSPQAIKVSHICA